MLTLKINESEYYDAEKEEFVEVTAGVIDMEHSLVSVSKWESKWEKPFLGKDEKTEEQLLDYIRMMVIEIHGPDSLFDRLSPENIQQINDYIKSNQTATWFTEKKNGPENKKTITAEVIYYWMVAHNIPFECQYWHINRLMTLIKVCNAENTPPNKKMSKSDIAQRNRELNAQRRAQLGTKG